MHLHKIDNCNRAIQEAMRLEATYEIINIEAKRRQNKGIGQLPNVAGGGSQAEAMDIGNLSMQQNYRKPNYGRGRGRYQRGGFN